MAPRWIGTRCRPIDISDAVGYLIGCVRTRGRQVGIRHPGRAGRNSPPGGGEPFPGPTASRVFRGTHVFRGADSRNRG